ncbi:MAG: hypothetical protein PHE63_00340 [Eubacteriales bacterium]|nr:hypothetical protein [Eubacteriales bacterium]
MKTKNLSLFYWLKQNGIYPVETITVENNRFCWRYDESEETELLTIEFKKNKAAGMSGFNKSDRTDYFIEHGIKPVYEKAGWIWFQADERLNQLIKEYHGYDNEHYVPKSKIHYYWLTYHNMIPEGYKQTPEGLKPYFARTEELTFIISVFKELKIKFNDFICLNNDSIARLHEAGIEPKRKVRNFETERCYYIYDKSSELYEALSGGKS